MVEIIKDDSAFISDVKKLASDDDGMSEWRDRLEADFEQFAMEWAGISKVEGDYEKVISNKPRTFSDMLTSKMANAKLMNSIPLYGEKKQRKEDAMTERLVYSIWTLINENTFLDPPPKATMAWYANNRGVVIPRLWLYEEEETEELIADLAIWDGLHTYWVASSKKLLRIVYVRWASVDELADRYGNDKIKRGADGKNGKKVYDHWDKEREAVIIGDEIVFQQPNHLKHIPANIFGAGNTPMLQSRDGTVLIKHWAESCFARNRKMWEYENRLLSFDMTQVGLATHTGFINEYDSNLQGEPVKLEANPWRKGKETIVDVGKGQKIYPMYPPPSSAVLPHLYNEIAKMGSRGAAPDVSYGQLDTAATAQGTAMLLHAASEAMQNGKAVMEQALTWIGNEIPRQWKAGKFKGREFRGFDSAGKGFTVKVENKNLQTDRRIVAKLNIDMPQDELQNADIWARLVEKGHISEQRAMDKYGHIEDPDAEMEIIDRERTRSNTGVAIMKQIEALIADDPAGNRDEIIFLQSILDEMKAQLLQQMMARKAPQGAPTPGNLAPRLPTPRTAPGGGMMAASPEDANIGLARGR